MAAQHLLCQTRPALVRVGLPLPYSRRAGDRALSPAAAGVPGATLTLADASRWLFRSPASLCRRPHGLSAADWRRPLRVSPPRLLLASVGSSRGRRHRSARLRDFNRPAKVPASPAGGRWRDLHDCALPARALLRQRDSGRLAIRGFGRIRERKPVLPMPNSMKRTQAGCWPRPACLCSSPSPTICAASVPSELGRHTLLSASRSPATTLYWKPYEQMERGFIPDDALMEEGGLGKFYFLPDLKVIDSNGA